MGNKLKVGVIFGGRSGEHEISLRSARAVIESIDRAKYEVVPIAITKEGKWLSPFEATALLPEATQALVSSEAVSHPSGDVAILGDPSRQGLVSLNANGRSSRVEPVDVIFPVLHGPYGEDGTLQGLLELADIPYVGCGVLASACGMDKVTMKQLFAEAGLPICKHMWFLRTQWRDEQEKMIRKIRTAFKFPVFVKPANLGSSVGVSRAANKDSLIQAVELAAQYDRKIIVEESVDARELECAVLGNDQPQASLPGEYVVYQEAARFLDYAEKYTNTGHVEFVVPAPVSKSLTAGIRQLAIQAFQAIDGAGLARVDFFLRRDTKDLLVNEINTLPGLTDVSGYPKMWAASGVSFPRVLDQLIELALSRHADKSLNKTTR
ncbi:MAG TPA: D-alanine--D-alanine ligase family protein [Pyrinomonadaceae bacterium]|nr:D-alanine--D-alanine ligase family protein [Pyrinomonadaceae bacterium]